MTIVDRRALNHQALALTIALTLFAGCDGESTDSSVNGEIPNLTGDTAIAMEPDTTEEGLDTLSLEDVDEGEDDGSAPEDTTETPETVEEESEPFPQASWCSKVRTGLPGERVVILDFARAMVGIGLFSPPAIGLAQAEAMAVILDDDTLLQEDSLDALLKTMADKDTCFAMGETEPLPPSVVEVQDGIAMITPGEEAPSLPEGVEGIIVNLVNVHPDADIAGVAALALSGEVSLGKRLVRKFLGLPAHGEDWTHYESSLTSVNESITGSGSTDLPLVFHVGPGLSPKAALVAGGLRMAGRAGLVGEGGIYAALAEATWSPVGDRGLLWRSSALSMDGTLWPDLIPVDEALLENWADTLAVANSLETIQGGANRGTMNPFKRAAGPPSDLLTLGTMRAALLMGYGMFDWFYPYFDLVGRELDDALVDGLEEVNELEDGDRTGFMLTLGRFMHDLYDGHGFYSDWASTDWPDGYLAAQIKRVEGKPVVRYSAHEGLLAGDTITTIDGVPADEWYEEAMTRYSASSDGYRFVLATDELLGIHGTLELGLKGVKGGERTEVFSPKGYLETQNVPWGGTMRENGWLTDLEAPDIYYLNMAGGVTPDVSWFFTEFSSIGDSAAGMVLDMRDYPNLDIYELARYFQDTPFTAPHFGFPTWTGPEGYELTFEIWDFFPVAEPYLGPVVLMVSNSSVSAAECISQMLMDLDHVTVVGQQSASTNGTITNFWVPGQLELTFTGMRLLNLDATDFHGIGVVPDVEVIPTPEQFAEGIDPELEAAIQVLSGP